MPYQNMPDGMVVHGVIQRQCDAARVAEDDVDVFTHKAFEKNASPTQEGRSSCC